MTWKTLYSQNVSFASVCWLLRQLARSTVRAVKAGHGVAVTVVLACTAAGHPEQHVSGSKASNRRKEKRTQQPQEQQQQRQQQEDPAAGQPGGGFVGLFVAGWMAVLSLLMQLLSPVFSLGLFVAQPLTQTNPARARAKVDKWVSSSCQQRTHVTDFMIHSSSQLAVIHINRLLWNMLPKMA
jgi:hypothetical protein